MTDADDDFYEDDEDLQEVRATFAATTHYVTYPLNPLTWTTARTISATWSAVGGAGPDG